MKCKRYRKQNIIKLYFSDKKVFFKHFKAVSKTNYYYYLLFSFNFTSF